MSDVFKVVRGFLGRYTGEVGAIADALDTLVGVVPVNAGDKANIRDLIDRVRQGATNVEKAVAGLSAPAKVVISKADIETAVAKVLPGIVADQLARTIAEAVKAEGTATADAIRSAIRGEVEAQVAALTVAKGGAAS